MHVCRSSFDPVLSFLVFGDFLGKTEARNLLGYFEVFSRTGFFRNLRGIFLNEFLGEFCCGFLGGCFFGAFFFGRTGGKNPHKNSRQNSNQNLGASWPKSTLQGSALDVFSVFLRFNDRGSCGSLRKAQFIGLGRT